MNAGECRDTVPPKWIQSEGKAAPFWSMFFLAICATLLCCLLAAGPQTSISPRQRLILTQPMALTSDTFSCETVAAGNHYPGQLDMPTALGPETRATREQFVRFDANAAAPYPVDFGCATSWSKLWGASRCGLMHPHHKNSDRFVWRRASDVALEIAAYAYDDGVRPYSPDNPNLLQPFATRLAVGAVYRLGLEVAPASTLYTLRDVNGTTLENKTVHHANACVNAATGYKLGLYFGGSCAAPYEVTVCYSPSNGWPQGVSMAFVLLGVVCLASCVWGAVWCHRRWRRLRRRQVDGGKSQAEGHVLALQPS